MEKLFIDYGNYIVGVPAILVAAVIAVWIYIRQRQFKALSYRVHNFFDLMRSDLKQVRARVQLGEKTYDTIELVVLEFCSTGSSPIAKSDFSTSIEIEFNQEVEIINAEVFDKSPKDLPVTLSSSKTRLAVEPLLLNQGDAFKVKILTSAATMFEVKGRIAGVPKIKKLERLEDVIEKRWVKNFYPVIIKLTIPILMIVVPGIKIYDAYIHPLTGESLIARTLVIIVLVYIALNIFDKYLEKSVKSRYDKLLEKFSRKSDV
jgi:hypothetical protein